MVATPQTIVISGYYGFQNSGDEAVLQSILNALQKQSAATGVSIDPVVLSIAPEWTTANYGVKSVHRMKLKEVRKAISESSGLISGGGSLLQDVTGSKTIPYYLGIIKLAQWMGKPTFIYAQGIGPVNRKLFHPLIKSVFRKCAYISVRDEQSRQLLHTMGLGGKTVEVVPDPVMGLSLPEEQGGQATDVAARKFADAAAKSSSAYTEDSEAGSEVSLPVVGISVRYWEGDRAELKAIAGGLLKAAEKTPLHFKFLPFHHPPDNEASRYVMDQLKDVRSKGSKISICEDALHPLQMLREVEGCDVLIGMRLHSLIYAAGRRVPLIGISYDPKIDHFLERIHCKPVGATVSLDSEKVASQVLELLKNGSAWRLERESLIASLVSDAESPARHIAEYLHRKG
ncbi:polysaccharide pyruvyl transferase CsaB [Bacillus sp. FJAT-27264]|uniref:polysaccharide pyruvyl transferase CsaB n=1 Tax=Paenibacillus sp. (strain DSM 101736 / FJAT-27264) TaxID=1850362 RepID=UPI000807A6A1|nr:polysaccharide pyruvyl transferase CsaB [Bacillus sp. FJAT-27264]OBZ07919.1 polysaccharide pyruvyl transferase CsaB [Bacillus sp. FJAT-27264]